MLHLIYSGLQSGYKLGRDFVFNLNPERSCLSQLSKESACLHPLVAQRQEEQGRGGRAEPDLGILNPFSNWREPSEPLKCKYSPERLEPIRAGFLWDYLRLGGKKERVG